jgi:hypothetical protein
MLEMIDATNTIESVSTDFMPEMADPQVELGEEITSLWVAHANAKIAYRVTNAELRILRAKLGEQLCRMKEVLARPGRGGQWSSFLEERQIPRATADRLVARYLRSLDPNANCVSEPISEPTEEDVKKLFDAVWPKLQRTLKSQQSFQIFIDLLTSQIESTEGTTDCPASLDGDFLGEPELGSDVLVAYPASRAFGTMTNSCSHVGHSV